MRACLTADVTNEQRLLHGGIKLEVGSREAALILARRRVMGSQITFKTVNIVNMLR